MARKPIDDQCGTRRELSELQGEEDAMATRLTPQQAGKLQQAAQELSNTAQSLATAAAVRAGNTPVTLPFESAADAADAAARWLDECLALMEQCARAAGRRR